MGYSSVASRRELLWLLCVLFIFTCTIRLSQAGCAISQFECADKTCIDDHWKCDGEPDCKDGSDELDCKEKNCTKAQMRCENRKCILKSWMCDGQDDCGDGTDENKEVCAKRRCAENEFQCKSPMGMCIPADLHCDKRNDCVDGSDEEGCEMAGCDPDEYRCSNGHCVSKQWVCDGDADCNDGSDELNCTGGANGCGKGQFTCNNTKCINIKWRCDEGVDCSDGSDEWNCPEVKRVAINCSDGEFKCTNSSDCISAMWRCDGDPDCSDASDELNCTDVCQHDQFTCKGNVCIAGKLECNGQKDCPDGSDEHEGCANITIGHRVCNSTTEFECEPGHCIDHSLVCNGANDCGESQDESNLCKSNECSKDNGGCADKCVDLKIGFKCECARHGFTVAADGKSCRDLNECTEIPGICSQFCNNTKGGYKCSCSPEYILEPGTGSCRARGENPKILFANKHDIRIMDLITNEYRAVISDLRSAIAVDYVNTSQTVVWADSFLGQINRAKLYNNITTTLLGNQVIKNIDGLALDWIHQKIYWTDAGRNGIYVAELLDGRHAKLLFNDSLEEPRAIVVDPIHGWMYWGDWGKARIERAGLDGSHRKTIVDTDIKWPNGLTIDRHDEKLYWVDAKLHLICRSDFNGGNRKVILSSREVFSHPFSIDVFEEWIYWSDWHEEKIFKVNKLTGENVSTVLKNIPSPMHLVVVHPLKQPAGINRCLNNSCTHLCLAAPSISKGSPLYTCLCPDGFQMNRDGHSCRPLPIPLTSTVAPSTRPPRTRTTTHKPDVTLPTHGGHEKEEEDAAPREGGRIAGMVIAALTMIAVLCAIASLLLYRRLSKARHLQSMNFDNPVYRKTTEDHFSLEKPDSPLAEPLTSPGTNDFV